METEKIIFLIFVVCALLSIFTVIGLMFYIGKTRVKAIDKVVWGYEFPNDSIFALMLRVPNYGGAFLSKWSAKRSGLEGKIEHFDETFKWPFKVVFILTFVSVACFIIAGVIKEYFNI